MLLLKRYTSRRHARSPVTFLVLVHCTQQVGPRFVILKLFRLSPISFVPFYISFFLFCFARKLFTLHISRFQEKKIDESWGYDEGQGDGGCVVDVLRRKRGKGKKPLGGGGGGDYCVARALPQHLLIVILVTVLLVIVIVVLLLGGSGSRCGSGCGLLRLGNLRLHDLRL